MIVDKAVFWARLSLYNLRMDLSQIRPVALLAITFLNCAFTFFVWLKGKSREAYHLGWLTFFSALYSLSWTAVFSFPNKLFWTRMTWIGFFLVAAIIYSKVNVFGRFELPPALASFEKNGKKENVFSNRAFFVSETTRPEF